MHSNGICVKFRSIRYIHNYVVAIPEVPLRIALISDIHANLEALLRALEHIHAQKVDRIYCLGDIVGYGANPSECLDIVRREATATIMGNHDEAVFRVGMERRFNDLASNAITWTRAQLRDEQVAYLRSLPYSLTFQDMLLVHSTPSKPQSWKYVFSKFDAIAQKDAFTQRVCFVGHSHIPGVYPLDYNEKMYNTTGRFLINVGSIGQPRDGNEKLSYGLLDTFAGTYDNIRLDYDVKAAGEKIRKAKLPAFLADRLLHGR